MSTAAPLQNATAKLPSLMKSNHAGLLLQRQCTCGSPKSSLTGECEACKGKTHLQTKLSVAASNDPLEHEADRVADQMLAAPIHSPIRNAAPRIQRRTNQTSGNVATAVPPSLDQVLASPGKPLDAALQRDMGQRFNHDFAHVRIHSGVMAAQSARELNAHAYTTGNNIVFGANQFAPTTHAGRRLLAHELTHVIQQNGSTKFLHRQMITPHAAGDGYSGVMQRGHQAGAETSGGEMTGSTGGPSCTPNPHGSALPPVGTAHRPPAHMLPCLLTEAQLRASPEWCVDNWQRHRGEICYRKIPGSYCAPADQYCFTQNGCCHNSPDATSPVDPASAGAGHTCSTAWRCIPGHLRDDVFNSSGKSVAPAGDGTAMADTMDIS